MPLSFEVPETICKAAARGLEAHGRGGWKLEGVHGLKLADALASGRVTLDVVQKMHRFFRVNVRPYLEEVRTFRTEQDSALVRSWLLHGAESGKVWAARLFKDAVEQGLIEEAPLLNLFKLQPEQVYDRFALGAWRFEYDLDPRKAARFVEEYMRATGLPLDLSRAFGEAARAVGNAVYRRYHTPDPFRQAFKATLVEDLEYRLAAHRDLVELRESVPVEARLLGEAMKKMVFTTMTAQQAAKIIWAPWIAYFILAVEAPELLEELNKSSGKPPKLVQAPKLWSYYHDAINTYIAYFHPSGKRYIDPVDDKKFLGIDSDVANLIGKVYYGKKVLFPLVRKTLLRARAWIAKNKLAGPLFRIFLLDWKKGNWQHILDNVPQDADVRPYFEQFIGQKQLPKDGLVLQQTLIKKADKAAVLKYAKSQKWVGYAETEPTSVSKTQAGKTAQVMGKPLGVYSVLNYGGEEFVYFGAWKTTLKDGSVTVRHIFKNLLTGKWDYAFDASFEAALQQETAVVIQGHKDMPGTTYGAPGKPEVPAPISTKKSQVLDLLAADFPEHYGEFKEMDLAETDSSAEAFARFDIVLQPGVELKDKNGDTFVFLTAYQTPKGPLIIMRNPDNELMWQDDADLVEIIDKGNVKLHALGDPGAFAAASKEAKKDLGEPSVPGVKEGEKPYLFKAGDVVKCAGINYLIVAADSGHYLVERLWIVSVPGDPDPSSLSQGYMEDGGEKLSDFVSAAQVGLNYVEFGGNLQPGSTTMPGFATGDIIHSGDDVYVFIRRVQSADGTGYILVAAPEMTSWYGYDVDYTQFLLKPESVFAELIKPSYQPTDPAPEPGAEDALDEPDETTGSNELCGTPAAISWITKKGWTHAVKTENPAAFEFRLGTKLAYGPSKIRVIVGYCINGKGYPCYVILTEKGNLNYKTTLAGNKAYGPVIETVQSVIDKLQSKPGLPEPKFPKLNYKLSSKAKEYAGKFGLIYVPAPKDAPFYVNSKLRRKVQGDKWVLLGWMEKEGELEFLVYGPEEGFYAVQAQKDLLTLFELDYAYTTEVNTETGEVTFGKGAGQPTPTVHTTYGVSIGIEPLPPGWDDPDPVEQPPMSELPQTGHVSAGIVAFIPSGGTISQVESIDTNVSPLVLLVHPMNEYAGYTLTFPKGTVESGESMEHAAVREVFEETGLSVKPVAFLGDFKGNQSVTRFYVGYITGGNPKKAGNETDAVTFKPLPMKWKEQIWYVGLSTRDKEVLDAAMEWAVANGYPHEFKGEKAATHSAVTGPQDMEGETGVPAYDPTAEHTYPSSGPPNVAAVVDYTVTSDVLNWAQTAAELIGESEWFWVPALWFVNEGYPPVGSRVLLGPGIGHEYLVSAYIRTISPSGSWIESVVLKLAEGVSIHSEALRMLNAVKAVQILRAPDYFQPIPKGVVKKTQTIPADTSKDDVWRALLFKAPYPVNEGMLAKLKDTCTEVGVQPTGFSCYKAHATSGAPHYGGVFRVSGSSAYFVCLGYVEPLEDEGAVMEYMFAQEVGDEYRILSATSVALPKYVPSADQGPFAMPNSWFTHPDKKINKLIQAVYANGGDLKAVGANVSTFALKWMKAAKVPAYAVTTKNMVMDLASLFVPGVATKPVYEAVIGALKARMKATHKGKGKVAKKMKAPVAAPKAPTQLTTPSQVWGEAVAAKKIAKPGPEYNSTMILQQVANPQPGLFKSTGHYIKGGSNPNMVLESVGGQQWFFKMPKDKEPARVHAEVAAFKLALAVGKANAVPVGAMEFEGQLGSFQPVLDGGKPEADPNDLPDEDKAEVLEQHMLDMFMGDHDGFRGNWMRLKNGKLVPVDRGQAFKFAIKGMKASFDPHWHAEDNVGEGYAKKLLKDWAKKEATIPTVAWEAMRTMIGRIKEIQDKTLQDLLAPVFEAAKLPPTKRTAILKKFRTRRDNYLKDWTTVLRKLRKGFKWPKVAKVKPGVKAPKFTTKPKDMGFGKKETQLIAEAVAAGKAGKAMKVDRDQIEQQEVMVKRVLWEVTPGNKVPSTLIHFRVARHAGIPASEILIKKAGGIEQAGVVGPQRLQTDVSNRFWEKIEAAVKTLNWHLADQVDGGMDGGPDGHPTEKTLNEAVAILPDLKKVVAETIDPAGTYGPVDESNAAVNAMASVYVGYVETIIQPVMADLQAHLHKHTPTLLPWLWALPTEEEEEKKPEAPVGVQAIQPARWPKIVQTDAGLVVQSFLHDPYKASGQMQFVVEDKNPATAARVHFNPPGPTNIPSMPSGIEGHKSIAWGIMKGDPTPANVAHLFKLFEQASKINMHAATKEDTEVLYWSKQAYVLQKGGSFTPEAKMHGVGIKEKAYGDALDGYRAGDTAGAKKKLKSIVAQKLGVSVEEVTQMAKDQIEGQYESGGVGFMRHMRIGWDRAKLKKLFGPHVYIVHKSKTNLPLLFKHFDEIPMLMSHNLRPFAGAMATQSSGPSDFEAGGTKGVFCGIRVGATTQSNILYFDISLGLRTDVIANPGDKYGNPTAPRYTTPEQWAAHTVKGGDPSNYTGDVGPATQFQITPHHGVNLLDYLHTAICASPEERQQVITICKNHGWLKFAQGRPVEKVIVVKGQEKL